MYSERKAAGNGRGKVGNTASLLVSPPAHAFFVRPIKLHCYEKGVLKPARKLIMLNCNTGKLEFAGVGGIRANISWINDLFGKTVPGGCWPICGFFKVVGKVSC